MYTIKPLIIGTLFLLFSNALYAFQTYDERLRKIADIDPNFAGLHHDSNGNTILSMVDEEVRKIDARQSLQGKAKGEKIFTSYDMVQSAITPSLLAALEKMYGADRLLHRPTIDSKNKLSGLSQEQLRTSSERSMHIRTVKYSFAQLYDWCQLVRDNIFDIEGVIGSDLDEKRNVISIIVSKDIDTGLVSIKELFSQSGIPSDALKFEFSDPVSPSVTVIDQISPVIGGTQIYWRELVNNQWRYHLCTSGFIATVNGQRGLLTNAHCSRVVGFLDGVVFQQGALPATLLGPNTIESMRMPNGRFRSDAAFIPLPNAVTSTTSVVKTQTLNSRDLNLKTTGRTRWINLYNFGAGVVGDAVYKTGRTTGSSSGVIDRTCINVRHSGTTNIFECQTRVDGAVLNNYIDSGDSGSAAIGAISGTDAFNYTFNYGRSVRLLGLHHAGNATHGYFSPLDAIIADIGNLTNFR